MAGGADLGQVDRMSRVPRWICAIALLSAASGCAGPRAAIVEGAGGAVDYGYTGSIASVVPAGPAMAPVADAGIDADAPVRSSEPYSEKTDPYLNQILADNRAANDRIRRSFAEARAPAVGPFPNLRVIDLGPLQQGLREAGSAAE